AFAAAVETGLPDDGLAVVFRDAGVGNGAVLEAQHDGGGLRHGEHGGFRSAREAAREHAVERLMSDDERSGLAGELAAVEGPRDALEGIGVAFAAGPAVAPLVALALGAERGVAFGDVGCGEAGAVAEIELHERVAAGEGAGEGFDGVARGV